MFLKNLFKSKPKPPKMVFSVKSEDICNKIDKGALNTLKHFFVYFYETKKQYELVSERFIRETYIYFFSDFPDEEDVSHYKKEIISSFENQDYSNPLLSYELTDYEFLSENEVMVGLDRRHKDGSDSNLYYVLKRYGDKWLLEHRVLFSGGIIKDKIIQDDHILYVVERGESFSLELDFKMNTEVDIGDTVDILCHYHTEGTINGYPVTEISRIYNIIKKEA